MFIITPAETSDLSAPELTASTILKTGITTKQALALADMHDTQLACVRTRHSADWFNSLEWFNHLADIEREQAKTAEL
jgi:hypothetical protein